MSDEDPLLTVEQYASQVFAKFLAVRRPSRAPPEGPARASQPPFSASLASVFFVPL